MNINIWIAFWGGIASFISPCCLPLYPSYLSYLTGVSVSQLRSNQAGTQTRIRTMLHSLCFIVGFSIVFYVLGYGAGAIGEAFKEYSDLIRQLSAIMIMVMGLFLVGLFRPQWLMRERKLHWNQRPTGYIGSLLIGVGFAAGWSPCMGPILSAIVGLAVSEPGTWFSLITAYSLGFAVPFLVLAFFIGTTKWILRYSGMLMKVGGVLMIVMGILLYTDQLAKITIWLNSITPAWMQV